LVKVNFTDVFSPTFPSLERSLMDLTRKELYGDANPNAIASKILLFPQPLKSNMIK
jgi:hypothetical protein